MENEIIFFHGASGVRYRVAGTLKTMVCSFCKQKPVTFVYLGQGGFHKLACDEHIAQLEPEIVKVR